MGLSPEQKQKLQTPIDAANVKTREAHKGERLSYVEGWWAINEANIIFGNDGWSRHTEVVQILGSPRPYKSKYGKDLVAVACMAQVTVTVGDCKRTGTGYGSDSASNELDAYEKAIKEAETDATKRALNTFGLRLGLELYDKDRLERRAEGEEANAPTGQEIVLALQEAKGSAETADGTPAWKESHDAVLATFSERDGVTYSKPDDLPPHRRVQWMEKLREQGASK